MKVLQEKFLSYIDGKITEHNNISEQYKEDDRKDESDLEKIKVNIYEIFRILFLSDTKQLKGKKLSKENKDIKNFYGGFIKRFDTIPANWRISLDKAKEHDDITQQVIEETKLAVAEELKDRFIMILNEQLSSQDPK